MCESLFSHLCSLVTEQHDQSQVSSSSREAQGAHAVFRHNIHAGTELEQQWGDLMVAEVALDAEHWGVVQNLSAVIHVSSSQHQESAYLVKQTHTHTQIN